MDTHLHHDHQHDHHHEEHLKSSDALRDIVIGMSDGLTVPFALAAGLSGAIDSTAIIVIAGITEQDHYNSELKREYDEVDRVPEREKAEVREFFSAIGLSESVQHQATE